MKAILFGFTIFCLIALSVKADNWAVLVAGSNQFYNYRHQSDIFHAYQVLLKNGIPASNIITMAYDDIANDPENPFPGKVFNKPSGNNPGVDVYNGVKIDYSGKKVTPTNFMNVLKGNSVAVLGKKVLKSTANDKVFIYFSDHGAAGLIAFPNQFLYADDFLKTLNFMSQKQMYSELVIYIEACESGSMFDGILPANISIYTTTAANPDESSWATYCAPNDTVNGTEIGSCLGDLYSVNFLENLESVNVWDETLQIQYHVIQQLTTESHVMQYGDKSIASEEIGEFMSHNSSAQAPLVNKEEEDYLASAKKSTVNSRYAKLHYLQNKHNKHQTLESSQALRAEIESIQRFDGIFNSFESLFGLDVNVPLKNIDFQCLKTRVAMYEAVCGQFSDYGLKYVRYIHFTCSQGVDIYDYEAALASLC